MDKKTMALLVIPLLLLSLIAILLNSRFPFDGFFINLLTEVIGIIVTVLYVDWIIRRHEKMKWKNVDAMVSEQSIIMVNTILSSIRDACKYSIEDVFGINGLYRLSRLDSYSLVQELIKGTENIIEPNLHEKVAQFDQHILNTLITNVANVHNACINYMSMLGNVFRPRQYELVIEIQNQSFKICEHFRTFGDIMLESDENLIKKYGEQKVELKKELVLLSERELLKLINCAKELGYYQINNKNLK